MLYPISPLSAKAVFSAKLQKASLIRPESSTANTTANIAVVSADYHLYRASLYWGTPGMVPVAAHMPGRYWPLTVNYFIREAFAVAAELVF